MPQFTCSANLIGYKEWNKDGKRQMLAHFVDLKARQNQGNAPMSLFIPDSIHQVILTAPVQSRCQIVQEGDGKYNKVINVTIEKVA